MSRTLHVYNRIQWHTARLWPGSRLEWKSDATSRAVTFTLTVGDKYVEYTMSHFEMDMYVDYTFAADRVVANWKAFQNLPAAAEPMQWGA